MLSLTFSYKVLYLQKWKNVIKACVKNPLSRISLIFRLLALTLETERDDHSVTKDVPWGRKAFISYVIVYAAAHQMEVGLLRVFVAKTWAYFQPVLNLVEPGRLL